MKAIDLFAGWGGFTLGAGWAGVDVVYAANHWQLAIAAHQANHPCTLHACQDIFKADWGKLPTYDILLASPACQGHSRASQPKRRKYHDHLRSTAWEVVKCARVTKPRAFVIENVPSFREWEHFDEWKRRLQELGYVLSEHIVRASYHDAPQRRDRLFVIGTPPGVQLKIPERSYEAPFGPSIQWEEGKWRKRTKASPGAQARMREAQKRYGDIALVQHVTGHTGIPITEPIRTVTTKDQWVIMLGEFYRPLTIREYARAMGFPDTYQWPVATRADTIKGIGNAVCPPVARDIVGAVAEAIRSQEEAATARPTSRQAAMLNPAMLATGTYDPRQSFKAAVDLAVTSPMVDLVRLSGGLPSVVVQYARLPGTQVMRYQRGTAEDGPVLVVDGANIGNVIAAYKTDVASVVVPAAVRELGRAMIDKVGALGRDEDAEENIAENLAFQVWTGGDAQRGVELLYGQVAERLVGGLRNPAPTRKAEALRLEFTQPLPREAREALQDPETAKRYGVLVTRVGSRSAVVVARRSMSEQTLRSKTGKLRIDAGMDYYRKYGSHMQSGMEMEPHRPRPEVDSLRISFRNEPGLTTANSLIAYLRSHPDVEAASLGALDVSVRHVDVQLRGPMDPTVIFDAVATYLDDQGEWQVVDEMSLAPISNPAGKEFRAGDLEVRKSGRNRGFGVWHTLLNEWVAEGFTRQQAENVAHYLSHGEGEQILLMSLGGDEQAMQRMQLIRNGGGNIPDRPKFADAKDVIEITLNNPHGGAPIQAKVAVVKRSGDWIVHYEVDYYSDIDELGFFKVRDANSSLGALYVVAYKDGRALKRRLNRKHAFALVDRMGGPWASLGDQVVKQVEKDAPGWEEYNKAVGELFKNMDELLAE